MEKASSGCFSMKTSLILEMDASYPSFLENQPSTCQHLPIWHLQICLLHDIFLHLSFF